MKTVKITLPLLIGDAHYEKDAVVVVTDEQAATMVRGGHASIYEGSGKVANPDANPLAEAITPYPPGGAVFNPIDALAPNVADNPGLVALAKAAGKGAKVQSGKVEGDARPAQGDLEIGPNVTANEVVPKAETASLASPPSNASTHTGKAH